ncbi:prepilin-type N-terminal cleavage/methylation domain-containing protein [Luteimonas marina]|uniref:Prepilin-type N-terminal cleavage/methylation domain-containing protein n=1 Tax=Luteimonas marina TaxID=488485 RepID=A0A5C5TYP7_9GAMM|nr:prepilin-type N-terminal cleavage/methylation domain-containing protein [Luteimonas marina]TWT18639.1 prepilin-type N-terminal cleavage/methylation domain-containing protein [Luteimonas marina]
MSTRRRRRLARARGFTLLEAIVAMVIMASSLLALYGWLSANTISLNRAQAQLRSIEDARTALSIIDTVNPTDEPSGQREVGPLEVRWSSKSVEGQRPGISSAGMPTQFDHELFELAVEVLRDGRSVRGFSVRKAGWVASRAFNPEED